MAKCFSLVSHDGYGYRRCGCGGTALGSGSDRRASAADLRARRGGHCVCLADVGQDGGGKAGAGPCASTYRAIRHEAALPEAWPQGAAQKTSGPRSRACRQSPAATDPHRSYRNTCPRVVPKLRRTGYAVSRGTHTADRGYPARHHGRSHPAYDPPLLVLSLSESGRARGGRCAARFDLGSARAGAVGVASLRLGQHAGADCRTSSTTTCV